MAADRRDRVLPLTRRIALFAIPFLVAAFIILYFFPNKTDQLFAWKLEPGMSAMMLAAAYAGGIYFFCSILLSRQWHRVKVGFLPTFAFTLMFGIATILHWDIFDHRRLAFYVWMGMNICAPFIVLAAWLHNRTEDPVFPEKGEVIISYGLRRFFGLICAITLIVAAVLFLAPNLLIDVWPWDLTPLTARVVAAMFSLPGVLGLELIFETRWSAARLTLQAQAFSIFLILVAAVVSHNDFSPGLATWLFNDGLALILLGIITSFIYMEAQAPARQV
jgi:hypothetical protein